MQINGYQSSVNGLNNSLREIDKNALSVAQNTLGSEPDNSSQEALIRINEAQNTAQANLKAINTQDEALGNLLDILA